MLKRARSRGRKTEIICQLKSVKIGKDCKEMSLSAMKLKMNKLNTIDEV